MMKRTFPLLLATTLGCASDVDLPLDVDRRPEPGSPSDPPLDRWARADYLAPGWIQDVVWTTDGAVVTATPMESAPDVPERWETGKLTRHGADGAIEWETHATPDDFFTRLAAIEGGGVVAAIRPDWDGDWTFRPAGLLWYDAEGNQTASWLPSSEGSAAELLIITALQPLPDGGVFWAGLAGWSSDMVPVAGLLDAQRQVQWMVTLPTPAESEVDEPTDVALTAGGDFVVLATYAPEDDTAPTTSSSAYVVQLGPDGAEGWRTELVGPVAVAAIRVASSGNLVVAGSFRGRVSVGDLVLEDEPYHPRHFVAEIDPAGQARGVHPIELPAWLVGAEGRYRAHTMTVSGDDVVLAGDFFTDALAPAGFISTTHRVDGSLVSEKVFALQADEGSAGAVGPTALDAAPDGRLAAGGAFSGSVDFGDGVVDSGVGENGFAMSRPFVAVFDPGGGEVD